MNGSRCKLKLNQKISCVNKVATRSVANTQSTGKLTYTLIEVLAAHHTSSTSSTPHQMSVPFKLYSYLLTYLGSNKMQITDGE